MSEQTHANCREIGRRCGGELGGRHANDDDAKQIRASRLADETVCHISILATARKRPPTVNCTYLWSESLPPLYARLLFDVVRLQQTVIALLQFAPRRGLHPPAGDSQNLHPVPVPGDISPPVGNDHYRRPRQPLGLHATSRASVVKLYERQAPADICKNHSWGPRRKHGREALIARLNTAWRQHINMPCNRNAI